MLNNIFYVVHSAFWTTITCVVLFPRLIEGAQPTPLQMGWCTIALYALCTMWAFTLNLFYDTEQE